MRRLVCAPAPACLLCFAVERAGLVNRVLRIGPVLQLPALHGDDLSRLSHRGGFSEIPDFYGSHHRPHCADADSVALLVPRPPLDFHALPHLESLALQRTELRLVHDVCPARRRKSVRARSTGALLGLPDFLPDPPSRLSDRPIDRPLVRLARNSGTRQFHRRLTPGSGIPGLFGLRLVWIGGTNRMASPVAGHDTLLHAILMVPLAHCVVHHRGIAASAESL